ncbi:MAG TPA: NnrS family protein [Bdellovibrionales bacterium]|nr:NnrS family protein [Bdellovibrionales bacterium]
MRHLAPYQIFFPLGLLNALLAVGVWFVQDLNWFDAPAIFIHPKLITGGFLWSFIVGFLMTAVPRMTGTASANLAEYLGASALMLGLTISSWNPDPRFFYSIQMAVVLFLLIYGGRRILRMKKPLPVFFSHVAMAMVLALLGSYFHLRGNSFMGIHLYNLGTVLLLVLGIGTRFFSFLSGLPSEFENSTPPVWRRLFHVGGLLMGALLFAAGTGGNSWAYLLLTLVSLFYLFKIWNVQRPSQRPSPLKYAVRLVATMIPLGFFLTWWQPLMFITWFHLLFIGCFGLITFSVAARVTLAHGAYPTELEMNSKALWSLLIFLTLAILSRTLYGFSGDAWKSGFLYLAATFWILAVLSWCWKFLPRIFIPGPQAKPSC